MSTNSNCPAHDIFLRDNFSDDGTEPLVGGGISGSPDIIVYDQLLDDPQMLVKPSNRNKRMGVSNVEHGQDNYVYLRVSNRGTHKIGGTAEVYWSRASTFPTPKSWHLIGTATIPPVPPGGMVAAGPIMWAQSNIPHTGHYCFVGLIGNGADPVPDKDEINSIDEYYEFIRANNNATWKNFDIIDLFVDTMSMFSFHVRGWPRVHVMSELIFDLTALPNGTTVYLKMLKRLSAPAHPDGYFAFKSGMSSSSHQVFKVTPHKKAHLKDIPLRPSDDSVAELTVQFPEQTSNNDYPVSIIQKINGKEVGRVTKQFTIDDFAFVGNRHTKEVHEITCQWAQGIKPKYKVPFNAISDARKRGYNGCYYCLRDFDTDHLS